MTTSATTETRSDTNRTARDERRRALAQQMTRLIAQGRRVESQSDYQAVLVSGHHFWESREVVSVDEWGDVSIQKLGINWERIAIATAVVVVLLILIIVGSMH
jgi:Tfp pilus assembly protein PilV